MILGASGSGKSTLLRMLNRLKRTTSGRIVVDGIEVNDDAQASWTSCAPRSAWCSSSSTCSRT